MEHLTDHAGLLDALGGGTKVAEALGHLPDPPQPVTVRAWAARNKIPPEYWPALIQIGAVRGIEVTAEWLMQNTPPRKRGEQDQSEAKAA